MSVLHVCDNVQALFRRKGLFRAPDSFNGFLLTAVVVHLVQRGVVVSAMSLHQAVRAVVQYLATTDLRSSSGNAIRLQPGDGGEPAVTDMDEFKAHFDCVIVDHTGRLNLAHRVSDHACVELQIECAVVARVLGVHVVLPSAAGAGPCDVRRNDGVDSWLLLKGFCTCASASQHSHKHFPTPTLSRVLPPSHAHSPPPYAATQSLGVPCVPVFW